MDLRDPAKRAIAQRVLTAYDAEGHKIASRDANDKTMSWEYQVGRLKTSVDMSGMRTTYGYDAAGRLVTQSSDYKQQLRYTYSGTNLVRIDDDATLLSTIYAYDAAGNRVRERQVYLGRPEDAPAQLQNNVLTYDSLNRLTRVQDDKYDLSYAYDANGNRVKITSRYGSAEPIVVFNAYDVMNRQTIVNGGWTGDELTGHAVRGKGHEITYDRSGNRLTDTYTGTAVTYDGASYGTQKNAVTTESYRYDAAGRLQTIQRDGLLIDLRRYDAAGRISQSGLAEAGAAGVADVLTALGIDSAGRVYSYDMAGHIRRQQDIKADLSVSRDIYFVSDQWNPRGGYDAMGNLTGYTVVPAGQLRGDNGRYILSYEYRDTYKESETTLATNTTTNVSKYDANGNRIRIESSGKVINRLWYDADGHVQSYQPDDWA